MTEDDMRRSPILALSLLSVLLLRPLPVAAQPSQEPLGPSILEIGSAVVDTDRLTFPGPDGGTPYEIGILTPKGPAPEDGFPVIFALDGQAVLELLTDDALAALPTLPVIVTLGYDTERRFAGDERTRDYTPPSGDGAPVVDPRGRAGGGAGAFLALIRTEIVPRVERVAPIDMQRSALWGHSYGGLFVLWAAGEPTSPFSQYVAASPSLWWDNGSLLPRIEAQLAAGHWPDRPLDLHHGGQERARASMPDDPKAQKLVRMRSALPEGALSGLDASLRGAGIPGSLTTFPGLSHGETFRASIRGLLERGFPEAERR